MDRASVAVRLTVLSRAIRASAAATAGWVSSVMGFAASSASARVSVPVRAKAAPKASVLATIPSVLALSWLWAASSSWIPCWKPWKN
jgi:hypothetical protein